MSFPETTVDRGATRDETHVLFAHAMGLVAITAGLFAVGAYLGRDMSYNVGRLWFIAAFGCLFGMNFAIRTSEQLAIGLLFGFGVLVGLATAPTIAYYTDHVRRRSGRLVVRRRFHRRLRRAGYATRATCRARADRSGRCWR